MCVTPSMRTTYLVTRCSFRKLRECEPPAQHLHMNTFQHLPWPVFHVFLHRFWRHSGHFINGHRICACMLVCNACVFVCMHVCMRVIYVDLTLQRLTRCTARHRSWSLS